MVGIIDGIIAKILSVFEQESIAPLLLFALVLLIAYYAFQVMQDIMIVIIISVAFPFMSNSVLGTSFATNVWSLSLFALLGIGLYFIYLAGSWLIKGSKILMFVVGILLTPLTLLIDLIKRLIFGKKKKKE